MDERTLTRLLGRVKKGEVSVSQAVDALKDLPFAELGFATVDTHRALRLGFPEVVLGQWKSTEQCAGIIGVLVARKQSVLVTRLQPEKARALKRLFPKGSWHESARIFSLRGARRPSFPYRRQGRLSCHGDQFEARWTLPPGRDRAARCWGRHTILLHSQPTGCPQSYDRGC